MKIKKQNLLLLASLVWMIAGFNVLRIGIETYAEYQTVINYIVTIIVFLLFWFMVFYKLTNKHTIRIQGYEEEKQLFYKFFDLKSFLIMAFMISFGIIIRSFHLLPERFIAVFYTSIYRIPLSRKCSSIILPSSLLPTDKVSSLTADFIHFSILL